MSKIEEVQEDYVISLKGTEMFRSKSEKDARSAFHKLTKKHGNDVEVVKGVGLTDALRAVVELEKKLFEVNKLRRRKCSAGKKLQFGWLKIKIEEELKTLREKEIL